MRNAPACRLTLLAAAVLATGCASLSADPPADARQALAVASARNAPADPSTLYAIGRQRLADGYANGALEAFDAALRADPDHVEARNGRATTLAQLGRSDLAVEELRRAIARAPSAAHLHNNLGYLLMTMGRLDEAELALRRAEAAEPESARVRANLAALASRRPVMSAGTAARTRTEASSQGVVNVIYGPIAAGARSGGAVLDVVGAGSARTVSPDDAPAASLPGGSLSSVTLEASSDAPRSSSVAIPVAASVTARPVPAPSLVATRAPAAATLPEITTLRLEVSNGAGTAGLARRTAGTLRTAGAKVARVTNHVDFAQRATSLHYRNGQRDAAVALQARLGLPDAALVRNDALPAGVDAKLVLGQDLSGGIALDRPLRAAYLAPLREEAAALQALLDATFV